MMHDGILRDGTYYWTCVNGRIVLVDPDEMTIKDEIDLAHVYGKNEPGWCRGLEVIGDLGFIGYSRYRKPSKKEFFQFAVRGRKILSTHILCYDLCRRKVVEDWFFPKEDTVIYAIHEYPAETM